MCQADAFVSLYCRDEPNAARIASPSDIEGVWAIYMRNRFQLLRTSVGIARMAIPLQRRVAEAAAFS
jgi:hypothetical protein